MKQNGRMIEVDPADVVVYPWWHEMPGSWLRRTPGNTTYAVKGEALTDDDGNDVLKWRICKLGRETIENEHDAAWYATAEEAMDALDAQLAGPTEATP